MAPAFFIGDFPMSRTKLDVSFRMLVKSDLADIVYIEQQSTRYPLGESEIVERLSEKHASGFLAYVSRRTVGFTCFQIYKDCFKIFAFGVDPQYRRLGVGQGMIKHIKKKLHGCVGRNHIVFPISEFDQDAHRFLLAQEFFMHKMNFGVQPDGSDTIQMEYYA